MLQGNIVKFYILPNYIIYCEVEWYLCSIIIMTRLLYINDWYAWKFFHVNILDFLFGSVPVVGDIIDNNSFKHNSTIKTWQHWHKSVNQVTAYITKYWH